MTHPIHPIIVHFPIALLSVAVFFDWLGIITGREGFRRTALHLLVVGILAGGTALLSGVLSEEAVEAAGVPEGAIEEHEEFAFFSMYAFGAVALLRWFFRNRWDETWRRAVYAVACVAALVLLGIAGYHGGDLVYEHGAGVKAVKPAPGLTSTHSESAAPTASSAKGPP